MLRTGLPRRAPAENAALPDLLTNLPGTATMAYHPPENYQDPEGWVGEDVFFHGADGTWRRLQLEDLGVPESAWPGPDTLGAGDLSPDGRWWAVESEAGVIVVNLASGSTRLIDLPGRYMNHAKWLPDSSAFVVLTFGAGRDVSVKVTLEGSVRRVPYSQSEVGFEPDGTPVSVESTKDGARVVEWRGRDTVVRGAVTPAVELLGRAVAPQVTEKALGFSAGKGKPPPYNLVTVDSASLTVESALRLPERTQPVTTVQGWLDADTLLIDTKTHVVAWRPEEGVFYRITDVPDQEPGTYWSVSVAADALLN